MRPTTHPTTARDTRKLTLLRALSVAILAVAGGFFQPAAAAAPATMTFAIESRVECGSSPCIAGTGLIGPRAAKDLDVFLRANPTARSGVLVLDSVGGDLLQGLKMGSIVRQAGLSTAVAASGQCASACAYAFLGGVQRTVATGARYGVHQFQAAEGQALHLQAADTQRLIGVISDYLTSVGASPGIVTAALRTPANRMHWMTSGELSRYAVVTAI